MNLNLNSALKLITFISHFPVSAEYRVFLGRYLLRSSDNLICCFSAAFTMCSYHLVECLSGGRFPFYKYYHHFNAFLFYASVIYFYLNLYDIDRSINIIHRNRFILRINMIYLLVYDNQNFQ